MATTSKKYLIPLGLVIILAAGLLIWTTPVRQPQLKEVLPTHVATIQVQRQNIEPRVQVAGRLQAARKTTLHFELPGQVAARHVEPGQQVQAGDLLLQLDDADFANAVHDAEAQIQQEKAARARDRQLLELMKREHELQARAVARLDRLGQDSLASKAQREEAQTRMLQLQAQEANLNYSAATASTSLRQRELAVDRARRNLGRTRLKAPFSGVINQVFAQAGDYVAPNVAALELLDTLQLDLYVEVTGAVAAAQGLGQQVAVRMGDQTRQARIVALQTDPNPATMTHAVRLRMDGQGATPGKFAVAELPLAALEGALIVPVSAVLREEDKAYVFTLSNNVLTRVEVILGERIEDRQIIKSGVEAGATVVAHSTAALADGQRVVVEKAAPTDEATAGEPVNAPPAKLGS